MPIYEYRCADCGRLTSVFVKAAGADPKPACTHCGGANVSRVFSRFAVGKSERTAIEQYGAEPKGIDDYKDPRQIGRWAERKLEEYGMEMPKQAREMIDAAREGELPAPVDEL